MRAAGNARPAVRSNGRSRRATAITAAHRRDDARGAGATVAVVAGGWLPHGWPRHLVPAAAAAARAHGGHGAVPALLVARGHYRGDRVARLPSVVRVQP